MVFKSQRSILLHLPTEIIDEILSYLSPREIRKLRSVCQYLNEKFYAFHCCQNEIVVWRNICDTPKMIKALANSNRSVWNLHIEEEIFVDNSILRFFEQKGHCVNSLSLKNCHLPPGLLEAILLKCDALCSFTFETTKDFDPRVPFDEFSTFESNSVVRPDVTHFKLVITKKNWLPDSVFRLFFVIFPNIKRLHLEINITEANRQPLSGLSVLAKTPITCTSIFCLILAIKSKLESLALHVPIGALHVRQEFVLAPMPDLKHLALGYETECPRLWIDSLGQWKEHFQHIPSFEIVKFSFGFYRLPQLLKKFQLVQIPPLRGNFHLPFTHVEFAALVKSKLEAVEIRLVRLKMTVDSVRNANLPVNDSVKDLTFSTNSTVRLSALSLFPEYFRGLVHLRLENAWSALLQSIFKYLVNLRSLYLGNCRLCTTVGFVGNKKDKIQCSIGDLKNLEHLTLLGLRTTVFNSRLFKPKFHLRRLKYLNIQCFHIEGRHNLKVPVKLFESFASLEALRLSNFSKPSYTQLRPLFQKLLRLRYFRCEGFDVLNENVTFVDLSEYVFNDINFGVSDDFYDKKTNKMVLINRWLGFRLFSPKISSFVIDWIEF